MLQGQLGTPKTDGDDESDPANVLIKYLVPPPVQKEFIEVFKGVKDGMSNTSSCSTTQHPDRPHCSNMMCNMSLIS